MILIRQTLQDWQREYDHTLDMASTADNHRKIADQSRVIGVWVQTLRMRRLDRNESDFKEEQAFAQLNASFRRWRLAVNERRTRRWEKDMALRARSFIKARDAKAKLGTWKVGSFTWCEMCIIA